MSIFYSVYHFFKFQNHLDQRGCRKKEILDDFGVQDHRQYQTSRRSYLYQEFLSISEAEKLAKKGMMVDHTVHH